MFFSEYSWHIHFWPRRGGGCPGRLKKKSLPQVISEILGLPWFHVNASFHQAKKLILSVTRSLTSLISALNIDTGFLGFFSGLIITLINMTVKLFCAKTESDKPRILKSGFWHIKTMVYANIFQDLIQSFASGYLRFYRCVLVNDATSNTKNRAERWRTTLIIRWILILCLLSVTSVIFRWSNMNAQSQGQ